jgi:ATP/maltotriose-dependent transcriptional regulator MalT
MAEPKFDLAQAHHWFAADCYNRAWGLIDKKDRTPAETEEMIELALASAWHWTQRADRTDENTSISYWQIARVYTLAGQLENARRYGRMCQEVSQRGGVPPFYLGYAYEAMARAEAAAGEREEAAALVKEARKIAGQIQDADEKQMLVTDLDTIPL